MCLANCFCPCANTLTKCRRTPPIWTLVIRIVHYPDRLGPSGQFVGNYYNSNLPCMKQHFCTWRNLPGYRHRKLFISGPCRKRADDLLRSSRRKLKMVIAILTGHAPVRKHLRTMGLFEGDSTCRFCRKEAETVQHIICRCEALARQRYNVFGSLEVEPAASVRDLCLFIRGTGLRNVD
jgi:hypothetical protein